MTFSILALSRMTLSRMTFSIVAPSIIICSTMTLSIIIILNNDSQHNDT